MHNRGKQDYILFSEIDPNSPESYTNKTILSFDVDWAIDEVLEYVIDKIEEAQVKATFFSRWETTMGK